MSPDVPPLVAPPDDDELLLDDEDEPDELELPPGLPLVPPEDEDDEEDEELDEDDDDDEDEDEPELVTAPVEELTLPEELETFPDELYTAPCCSRHCRESTRPQSNSTARSRTKHCGDDPLQWTRHVTRRGDLSVLLKTGRRCSEV